MQFTLPLWRCLRSRPARVAGDCLITSNMSICGRMHVAAWAVSLGWLGSQPLAWGHVIAHTRVSVMHESILAFQLHMATGERALPHTRVRAHMTCCLDAGVGG
jgi:hypothetical protein